MQQDLEEILIPFLTKDKTSDRPIMNIEIYREENLDINYRVRHIIKLTQDWIKKQFKLDPIPQIVVFHAQFHPAKG